MKNHISSLLFKMLPATVLLLVSSLNAQAQSAATFDIDRYSTAGEGWFETFYVEDSQSLQAALDSGTVKAEMDVLVTITAKGNLALLKDQMAFHHIAQGSIDGKDWMATF